MESFDTRGKAAGDETALFDGHNTDTDCSAHTRSIEGFGPCKHQNLAGLAVMQPRR
jgi:hypothetical protein